MKKYGLVTISHGGFPEGAILELVDKTNKNTWICNYSKFDDFKMNGALWCNENYIKHITKEKDPEYFL